MATKVWSCLMEGCDMAGLLEMERESIRRGPRPGELGRRPEPVEAVLWYVPAKHGVQAIAPAESSLAKPMPHTVRQTQ